MGVHVAASPSCTRIWRADDAAVHCMRANATRFLSKAIDGTHAYLVFIDMAYSYVSTSMRLATQGNGSPMRACNTHAPTGAPACARAPACVFGRPRIRAEYVRALSVGVDRVWLGSQAFYQASAFNANIGAWNTASVTTLASVRAALGPAARHRGGRARPGLDAARPFCAAAPPMCAHTCAHAYRHCLAWTSACGCVAVRRLRSDRYVCFYGIIDRVGIYTCLTVDVDGSPVRSHTVAVSDCRCGRALRQRVCLGAHASTPNTCEPFPSASTACGSARRRSSPPVRRRSTRTSARGTPRLSPA
jgi:hypothetical protein